MSNNHVHEFLEAYALDALEPDERVSVENHLARCVSCRRLANEYRGTSHVLAEALTTVAPVKPPDSIKKHLMASITSSAVKPAYKRSQLSLGGSSVNWFAGLRPNLQTAFAFVMIIMLIVSLAWSAQLSSALAQERTMRSELASLVSQQEMVLEVLDSPKTTKAFLRATNKNSTAYGKIFVHPGLPDVVTMAARLPQPSKEQAYHLWVTIQGKTQLLGVINVNSEGFGLLVYEADRKGPIYDSAQLTLQAKGSTLLSGEVILAWTR